MAKQDYSEFVVILDRSGSMQLARADHEGGLNSFVKDQKELEGLVKFTFIRFDTQDPCEVVYDGVPIEQVGHCQLVPRGRTPLLDAVGMGVSHVAERLVMQKRTPDQVVVMIITDGEENSSREWTKDRVQALVKEREEKDGWKFLFLGANIDAFAEAGKVGVSAGTTMSVASTPAGLRSTYSSASANATAARRLISAGKEIGSSYDWTQQQRKDAQEGGDVPGRAGVLKKIKKDAGKSRTSG